MFRDLGDFQTPPDLVAAVLDCLGRTGKHWARVLEPTCGIGNFIGGLLAIPNPPREIQGIELQLHYVGHARNVAQETSSTQVQIQWASIFNLNLHRDLQWKAQGPLLIIGNPPWITNSELGALDSKNVPVKANIKRLNGLDAMTGEANFDIAEAIWLKLIQELAIEQPTIALLCKTSVARNVLQYAYHAHLPISKASIWKINSKESFGASVDACLFYVEVGVSEPAYFAEVYPNLQSTVPESVIGIRNGRLATNFDTSTSLDFIDGACSLTWRQGLKHDAASVLELIRGSSGGLYNKLGECVNVEAEFVYPLLKSSDLGGKAKVRPCRSIIVPQKSLGEDTNQLRYVAPDLWRYLTAHREEFEQRKSSIYQGQSSFAIFGVGGYSFAPYKVAISGMYKTPTFRAVAPKDGRPVLFDDTCYFVACASAQQAALVVSLLNHPLCFEFIQSIVFWDSKRPITKKLLQRIDLASLLNRVDTKLLMQRANTELERLGGASTVKLFEWPDELHTLLVDYTLDRGNTIQMSLLEAF